MYRKVMVWSAYNGKIKYIYFTIKLVNWYEINAALNK